MRNFFRNKKVIIVCAVCTAIALVLAALGAAGALYLGDYYRADDDAIAVFAPEENITFKTLEDGDIAFIPKDAKAGFIFYPGGKVEHNAYQPLMAELARNGILCILVKMPFNLAVLDVNAADGLCDDFPEVTQWYIGGHSLGGSMAATYLEGNKDDFEGLILLGSYSTSDLSGTDLTVISIFGSEDKIMNSEKYKENKGNLPSGFVEVVIEGANHAQFGSYGHQDGDGTPKISAEEQIDKTVEIILGSIG